MHDPSHFIERTAALARVTEDSDLLGAPPPHDGPSSGMGTPSGPSFAPWSSKDRATPTPPRRGDAPLRHFVSAAPRDLAPMQPARSRLPATITTLAILLVGAFVLVGTFRTPRVVPAEYAESAPAPSIQVATATNSIDISSARGSGRLTVVSHSWRSTGRPPPAEARLRVEVQLVCSSGRIDYDPYFFQAFDARGRLFEVADSRGGDGLEPGSLGPGQRVRGVLFFALPRGDVTLLMTDDTAQTVTALRITG